MEVLPFGVQATARHLQGLGLAPQQRIAAAQPFLTDNGNLILDCATQAIVRPEELEAAIRAIPGVVGTGLFLEMASIVLVQRDKQVDELKRPGR